MQKSYEASLEDRLREEIAGGRVVAALFSSYTFSRDFFENVALPLITEDGERLGRFPITVIVDKNQFTGQGKGYGIVCPPITRIWHAKLILFFCRNGTKTWTVMGVGSGNLTRAGWEWNQEVFRVTNHAGFRIPRCIDEWLHEDWLIKCSFADWRRKSGTSFLNNTDDAFLFSSWTQPIWKQIGGTNPSSRWREAHIVSPYCEKGSTEDGPLRSPRGFFLGLQDSAKDGAVLHLYLAGVPGRIHAVYGPADFLKNQLPRMSFRTVYHRVDPVEGRPLHAKLFAFRIKNSWKLLIGSPNASGSALTEENGNVELAFELWPGRHSLPSGFLPQSECRIRLADLEFVEPANHKVKRWHAIKSASYVGPGKPLVLEWAEGHSFQDTLVRLGQIEISADMKIDLDQIDTRMLETRPRQRRTGIEPAYVPIQLPPERFDAPTEMQEMNADQWLACLGAAVIGTPIKQNGRRPGKSVHPKHLPKIRFNWRDRVQDLIGRLNWVSQEIVDAETPQDIDRLVRLVRGVWRSHDPSEQQINSMEVAWRKWVRAGLWQAIGSAGKPKDKLRAPVVTLHKDWKPKVPKKLRGYPIVND